MTKIITIAAMKGGVGKTMLTVNLAATLAEKARVLVIDADPQSNATSGLGIDVAEYEGKTIADIFEKGKKTALDEVIYKAPVKDLPKLDVVPSTIWLTGTEMNLVSRSARESIILNYLAREENKLTVEKYDYLIFDTNPSMGIVNQNAFLAADSILLVTDVSYNGAQGIDMYLALWESIREDLGKKDNVSALIINNADKRIGLSNEIKEYLADPDLYGDILCKTSIPQRVKYKETEIDSTPINVLYPKSEENNLIHKLIAELKKKGAL